MLKKTITYTDYNGEERTEDFYFNLTQSEMVEMELTKEGGLVNNLQKIVNAKEYTKAAKIFKDIILKSYGEKSDDGKRFRKSEDISKAFSETEAYNKLFMELVQSDDAMAKFITQLFPADIQSKLDEEMKKEEYKNLVTKKE